MRQIRVPLLVWLMLTTVFTTIPTNAQIDITTPQYTCKLQFQDIKKDKTYTVTDISATDNNYSLVRINGSEPSRREKSTFSSLMDDAHSIYKSYSTDNTLESIEFNGRKYTRVIEELYTKSSFKEIAFQSNGAHSGLNEIRIFVDKEVNGNEKIASIHFSKVNSRDKSEIKVYLLRYYDYRLAN